jgi:hypothetical protein
MGECVMKKKNLAVIFAAILFSISAFGCGKATEDEAVSDSETIAEEAEEDSTKNTEETVAETEEAIDAENVTEAEETEYTFEDLSKYSYEFCSGAGGWSTDFTIEADGYFSGNYHDSEMGSFGEGYPNGTMYAATFTGHFTGLKKVDEYAYEMTIADISYENEIDTEEIRDNIKYIYSDAYGLTDTNRFLVYFPGTPVSVFNEEVYSWIMWSVEGEEVLSTPVIVNEDQQEGIYSYEMTGLQ